MTFLIFLYYRLQIVIKHVLAQILFFALISACLFHPSNAIAQEASPPAPAPASKCQNWSMVYDYRCIYDPNNSKWLCAYRGNQAKSDFFDINDVMAPKIKLIILKNMVDSSSHPECADLFEVKIDKYLPKKTLRFFTDFAVINSFPLSNWKDFPQKVEIDFTNENF
jgi:hypothetical protein